ncbi:MAG: serine kinase [Spirochaetes bacterium]|nr:serine kinase [Spirochaetota bacterium]
MKLSAIIRKMGFEVVTGKNYLDRTITHGYVSDLLSDVIANAHVNDLWITLQGHPNIVAVASMKELGGIILVNNRKPEVQTIQKAEEEGIPILLSALSAFEVIGRLWDLGISGSTKNA